MAALLDQRELVVAVGGDADFLSHFLTRGQLAARWRTTKRSLRRLEQHHILPEAIRLPGRHGRYYRIRDIAKLEGKYTGEIVGDQRVKEGDGMCERMGHQAATA